MIALEVSLNGKRVCIAGAEDLGVLSTTVSAVGKLGNKTIPARPDETGGDIHYSVGGLTSRQDPEKDVHLRWKSIVPLKIGDFIQVKILETDKADRAISRSKANRVTPSTPGTSVWRAAFRPKKADSKRRSGEASGHKKRRSRASVRKRK